GVPDYICTTYCADPLAKTLFLSDSALGNFTLVWNNGLGKWLNSPTYGFFSNNPFSFPGNACCPAASIHDIGWNFAPPSGNLTSYPIGRVCPTDSVMSIAAGWNLLSKTCGSGVFTATFDIVPGSGDVLYCHNATLIVSE